MDLLQRQVEGQVTVGHGHDGINGVRIAAAHHVAQLLVDEVDRLTAVILGGQLL